MITTGTTPVVGRFITEMSTTEVEANAAELAPAPMKGTDRQMGTPPSAVELAPVPTKGTGRQTGTPAGAAEIPTVPAQRPGLLKETTRLLEGSVSPAVRAASARAPSAGTTMADRQGAFRHAEAPASAAEQRVAAVAGIDNRTFVRFQVYREI
jgi:hypothetical protein